jgi:RNA polymerase sigma-70 factor, ECF subfamily
MPAHVSRLCNFGRFPGFISLVNHAVLAFQSPLLRWLVDTPAPDSMPAHPPVVEDEDSSLFERAATGNQPAWQELFTRWKKPLLSFFYRSLGSMPEAEDLTLEVFVRLHRSAPTYERRSRFTTYLFHIARNLLLNELRRRRRKPAQLVPPEAFDYVASNPGTDPLRLHELEEEFQRALSELPESQRTLLLLVQQQGLDQPAAAATLGITENALRVQLHRARQRLKELMSRP